MLTRRFARLVSRETCARVARRLGVQQHLRLGPQARSDGGADSDNILGDVMEALIGAAFLEGGMAASDRLVRSCWAAEIEGLADNPKHPKSAVQEWAAAQSLRSPVYRLLGRSGPHHNPRFRVELSVAPHPPVIAEGASKQEAETLAAQDFLAAHGR
jgi:ribonuclease-3